MKTVEFTPGKHTLVAMWNGLFAAPAVVVAIVAMFVRRTGRTAACALSMTDERTL